MAVLWLQRPPLMRWAAAACLVAAAAWTELAPSPTTTLIFLTKDVAAGTPLAWEVVERRRVPLVGFETVDPTGVAATDLSAGEPLVASMVASVTVPAGWVVIEAPVPSRARPGQTARAVILTEDPLEFAALIVDPAEGTALDPMSGSIAVPGEWTAAAAAAAAQGLLVIGLDSRSG